MNEVGEDPNDWGELFLQRIAERKKLISEKGVA
jgi:type IV secretion system protein VirB4